MSKLRFCRFCSGESASESLGRRHAFGVLPTVNEGGGDQERGAPATPHVFTEGGTRA